MRDWHWLECSECKGRNYRVSKSAAAGTPKLERSKFCRTCRKHTAHKERKGK